MGFGKKKEDAAVVLGRLKVMPWEREPLTEIRPLRESAAQSPELDDQGTLNVPVQPTK